MEKGAEGKISITKRQEESFKGNGCVHYLECDGGFTGISNIKL